MLQKLNERIQGVVAWVVIILIAVTFTLFGVDYYMQSHQASDAEVEVNGQPISKQTFELSYRRARQQRDPSQLNAASEQALKQKVLTDLITNEVSIQAAQKAGFYINSELANTAILGIPQFQEDGHFSAIRYQQALSGAMFTAESFQKEVTQGMLLNQQRFAFMGSVFVLPEELKRFVKLSMQTRDYSYLVIPASSFLSGNNVTEEEISKYYAANPREFLSPEKVSIDFVRLSAQQLKAQVNVSEQDVKRYYDENKSNYLTPAQWKVAHILFAVPDDASEETESQIKQKAEDTYALLQKDPGQFNTLLKTKTDDKLSISTEGVLPWLVAGQSGFDKTLATLSKAGEIAPPVKSPHGYEIFKLVEYKPAVQKSLTDVESSIKEQLVADAAQTHYAKALEQLSDLSYQSPDSLSPVADALKLQVEQTGPFSREGGDTDLTRNKQLINAAFSPDVLELGNNSEAVQLDNDTVIVLRVNKHLLATEKPLNLVKDEISKKLALQNAEKRAKAFGTEWLSSKDKNQQQKLLQDQKLQWHEVSNAARESDKTDTATNELAFTIPRVESSEGMRNSNGDYVIVRLTKINDGQVETLNKEQLANLTQQIESNYGVMDYDLYINNLVAKAKIDNEK
ncbi:MAG: SurA N-terminal domain-containing protein [Tatlockia sp.]|jgi:peptidyl-prolyl cis-trans isomerase D